MTTVGRSSSASGSSASRAAWFLASIRAALSARRWASSSRRSPPRSLRLRRSSSLALAATHRAPRAASGPLPPGRRRRGSRARPPRGVHPPQRPRRCCRRRCRRSRTTARSPPLAAACSISSSPAAGRPSLVGVSQTGPTLIWSGRASPLGGQGGVELLRRVRRETDQGAGTGLRSRFGHGRVVLAHVDAVRAARLDQLRVVVEEEQRAVLVRGAAERLGQRDDLLGAARGLLAELDQVDAAAQRRVEQGLRVAIAGPSLADEVEAGAGEPLATPRRIRSIGGGVSPEYHRTGNGSPTAKG